MKEHWVQSIQRQCQGHGIPFFFKQRGGVNKQATGNLREGRKMAGGSRMNRPCCVCGGFGWTGG